MKTKFAFSLVLLIAGLLLMAFAFYDNLISQTLLETENPDYPAGTAIPTPVTPFDNSLMYGIIGISAIGLAALLAVSSRRN